MDLIPGLRSLRSLTRGYYLSPLRGSSSQTIERRILAMLGQRTIRIVAAVLVLMVCLTFVAGADIVFGRQVWSDWITRCALCCF
jgi:hypothetical protein